MLQFRTSEYVQSATEPESTARLQEKTCKNYARHQKNFNLKNSNSLKNQSDLQGKN